jgi:hypothetical protein
METGCGKKSKNRFNPDPKSCSLEFDPDKNLFKSDTKFKP